MQTGPLKLMHTAALHRRHHDADGWSTASLRLAGRLLEARLPVHVVLALLPRVVELDDVLRVLGPDCRRDLAELFPHNANGRLKQRDLVRGPTVCSQQREEGMRKRKRKGSAQRGARRARNVGTSASRTQHRRLPHGRCQQAERRSPDQSKLQAATMYGPRMGERVGVAVQWACRKQGLQSEARAIDAQTMCFCRSLELGNTCCPQAQGNHPCGSSQALQAGRVRRRGTRVHGFGRGAQLSASPHRSAATHALTRGWMLLHWRPPQRSTA